MIKRAKTGQAKIWAHTAQAHLRGPFLPDLRGRLLKGTALTASLVAVALSASIERAYANPEGGEIVGGVGTISSVDDTTINIDQVSDRIVIDWTSFSIDEDETVNFDQPDSGSVALNRVIGFDPSYIDGVLTADGYVFLVNQSGVIFGRTAFVDVGGLVATTADITNENFMSGNFDFNIASPNQNATIINEGLITVAQTGMATLVAPTVRNSGIISARLGSVGLAGARTFTLDFYGDGLFSFDTGAEVTAAPEDGGALVENTGVISADGGVIAVTALAAEDIVNNVINMDGVVEANSVGVENGVIVLSGGDGGVSVSGDISAAGDDAGEIGGSVTILGGDIVVDSGASVSVTGGAGGGDIRIGGGYQGGGDLPTANSVIISEGATVNADALADGDGGDIILWADGLTENRGNVSARGGADGGDGGFVEVSGKQETLFLAAVDVGAPNGSAGEVLIDPNNFTVTASVSAALEGTLNTGGTVTVLADNDVFVINSINGAASTISGGGISISSGRSTSISAGVTVSTNNGNIDIIINDDARTAANRSAGNANFDNNGIIDSNGGNISITNGALSAGAVGTFETGSIVSGGGSIGINNSVGDVLIDTGTLNGNGGDIGVTAGGTITVGNAVGVTIDASAGGDVILDAGADIVGGNGVINMGGGTLTFTAGGGVGSSASLIHTDGVTDLFADAAAGGVHVQNTGSATMSVHGASAAAGGGDAGDIVIRSLDGSMQVDGAVDASGSVILDAGFSDFSNVGAGSITAGMDVTVVADTVGIAAMITADNITIRPESFGPTMGLSNASGTFNLTNAEFDFLNTTGTVTLGVANPGGKYGTYGNYGSIFVGDAGTLALADNTFNLVIRGSDITFNDSATGMTFRDGGQLTLDVDGINGGGAMADIQFAGSSSGQMVFDVLGGVDLRTEGLGKLTGTATGPVVLANAGDLSINHLASDSTISLTNFGDTDIETGTIVAGGDIGLTISGTLTIGSTAGVAIDASGGLFDVSLSVTGDIVDGDGIIDMSGGGTLTMNAGGAVGAGNSLIDTSGTFSLSGFSAGGGFHVANSGGTMTVQSVNAFGGGSATGDITLFNSHADLEIAGTVTGDGNVTFYAGNGDFSVLSGGSAAAAGELITIANTVDIRGMLSGRNIILRPNSAGTTIGFSNATGTFNLTNAEFDWLNTTGTVSIGAINGTGAIGIGGAGTLALADNGFDLFINGGDLTFGDGSTGMTFRQFGNLSFDVGHIVGGGVMPDIDFAGSASSSLNFDAAGDVDLITIGLGSLTGTATGSIALDNSGVLSIDHLEAGGTINLTNDSDTTVETGTIIVNDTLTMDITGDLSLGTTAGVAINATSGAHDVILTASGSIFNGGGRIDMAGGALQLDAGNDVGGHMDGVRASGTMSLSGSTGDGDFFVEHTGGATITVTGISVARAGTATGDVAVRSEDSDIRITGAVTADGDIGFGAGTGDFSNTATLTAGEEVFISSDTIEIGAMITAGNFVELRLHSTATTIGLNDSSGTFNLSEAELQNLSAEWVDIGHRDGTGDIFIAGQGTIDLTGGNYTLTMEGGDVYFDDNQTAVMMGAGLGFGVKANNIFGGGVNFDVVFPDAGGGNPDGLLAFIVDGDVTLRASAGELAGSATGDIDIYNSGNLEVIELIIDTASGTMTGETITGLSSSAGSINLEVASDLTLTAGIDAADEIILDAGTGAFTNSGDGHVSSANSLVEIVADTVNIGATISGTDISLAPGTTGRSVGLGSASGAFNLADAEFGFLQTTGTVAIGLQTGTGSITIGDAETIDLTTEGFDLALGGGDVTFSDARLGLNMADGARVLLDVADVSGGGSVTDIAFQSATGALGFTSSGTVTLNTEASLMMGSAAGDITIDNIGDLEIGGFGNGGGLASGGTISVEVHSDLTITGAINATGDVLLDANSGQFANMGSGAISAGGNVLVEADTVALGAAITGVNIALRPDADATSVGLSDASGTFNLSNAELDYLASSGTLTIGRATGVGDIFVGGMGTVDLVDENFDLVLQGGALTFADSDPSLALHQSSTAILDVASIAGGGSFVDVGFAGGDGALALDVTGGANFFMDGSTLSGMVGGSLEGLNAGDLTVGTAGGYVGLSVGSWTRFDATGGSLTLEEDFTAGGDTTLQAQDDLTLNGGDLDANGGMYTVALVSDTGMITTAAGSTIFMSSGGLWLDAASGINVDTQGLGTTTFTIAGVTDTGDLEINNTVAGSLLVGPVGAFGSGLEVINAPGAGGGDLTIENDGHGGGIEFASNVTGANDIAISADGLVRINSGVVVDSTRGGFVGMRSLFNQVTIDGTVDARGTGNAMFLGNAGINGAGTILMASNGLGLETDLGDIDITTQGSNGQTFELAASAQSGGDVTVTNVVDGSVLIGGSVSILSVPLGVDETVWDTSTPDGDIYIRNSAVGLGNGQVSVASNGTVGAGALTASGNVTLISDTGGISIGDGATVSGSVSVSFSAAVDIAIGDSAEITSGGPLSMTAGGSISAAANSALSSAGGMLLDAVGDISFGTTASVTAGGTLTATSSGGSVMTGQDSTVTGASGVAFSADQNISIGNGAFAGSPQDVSFQAGLDVTTAIGSTVRGGTSILFNAGGDITTNGTTDASTSGAAVTLLSGGTITDGGNTYLFTDGTLRAAASGDVDLTLSGTAGATVTAAITAGGSVDLLLRDGGDLTIGSVTSGGGTTMGVMAAGGHVDIAVEDGLLTINENVTAMDPPSFNIVVNALGGGSDVILTADDMAISSIVSASGDIYINPYTDGNGIALNDVGAGTLNLTTAEVAFLDTFNSVQFGRVGAGDIVIGGDGSLDLTGANWNDVRFLTDSAVRMTAGVESQDLNNLFDADVVLTGASVIDTVNGGIGGNVTVTGTIEGATAGGQSLTITAGASDIEFQSQVGQITPLGALSLSGNNIVVTDIATIGTQTFAATGEVTFGSDYTTSGYAFSLSGGLTLADDVLVDTTIPAGTGAAITIDDVTGNGYTLSLNAGNNGAINLDSWTNVGAYDGLGTLRILDSDTTTVSGTVSGDTFEVVDSTTNVSLLGDVELNSLIFGTGPYSVNLTGGSVFLVGAVDFNNTGTTTLGDSPTDTFVFTGGVDATNGGTSVAGNFTFGGTGLLATSLSLQADTTFNTAGGNMQIGTVYGNGYGFGLDAGGTGDIYLGTVVNPAGTGGLNIINADIVNVSGDTTAGTVDIDTAQTSVTFEGMLTATDLIVGAGNYMFSLLGGSLITNFVDFLSTGGVVIGDEDEDENQFLAGAESTASQDTYVGGTIQSEGGGFTFGDLWLIAHTTIDSALNTPGGQDIHFLGTINNAQYGDIGGGNPSPEANATINNTVLDPRWDLVVNAGNASTANFVGNVGDVTPIGSLNVSALDIILHDVTTVGTQIYSALSASGSLGTIELNSTYQTMGSDFDLTGNVDIGNHATVDTTYGGAYTVGNIYFGGTGGTITFKQADGTLTLLSGGSTHVRAEFAGLLTDLNSATVWARDDIYLSGGTLGNDLTLHAGGFNGTENANNGGDITINGVSTIGDSTDMTATGNVTFLGGEFNTYALRIRLNGLAENANDSPLVIGEIFEIGGLTLGLGESDLWGSIRGSDSEQAAAIGDQLEEVRRDDFLFSSCVVEVGCLNFEPSVVIIPVFDPVIYLYEKEGSINELRYSDLPNTEIWFGLGGAPDIWEERLGISRSPDDDESEE